jgi:alkylhydroperoxidase family enzyme
LTTAGSGELTRLNIYTTVARHPGLMRRWLPYGGKLLYRGKLPPRVRELVVLRTAWLCQAAYEWGQHVAIAHEVGMTADEVQQVVAGPDHPGWDELDAAIIRLVDELHNSAGLSDPTWATLSKAFDDQYLIELVMLSGHYHSVAYLLNTCGVPLEDNMGGLEVR